MQLQKTLAAVAILAGLGFTAWQPALAFSNDKGNGWTHTRELIPLNAFVANGCGDGESVNMIPIASIKTSTRVFHGVLSIRQNIKVSGVGTGEVSGATYRLDEKDHIRIMDGLPLPFSFSQSIRQKLKGAGVPDQIIRFESRFEVDINGIVVNDFVDFSVVCK